MIKYETNRKTTAFAKFFASVLEDNPECSFESNMQFAEHCFDEVWEQDERVADAERLAWEEGYLEGKAEGNPESYLEGYDEGYDEGFEKGYQVAMSTVNKKHNALFDDF